MSRPVRAEWTKARTLPVTAWLLLATTAALVVVALLAAVTVDVATCTSPTACTEDTTKLTLAGVWVAQAVVVVLAVLTVGNEYGTRMIATTLTAVPWRPAVLAAKAAVVAASTLAGSALGVAGAVLVSRAALPSAAVQPLTAGSFLRASGGTVLYLVLVGLLAVGVAALVRDTAGAITGTLALLFVAPAMAMLIGNPTWHERLQKFSPMTAGMAVQATLPLDRQPIGPWAGLGVLAGWTAAALAAGTLAFVRRDV